MSSSTNRWAEFDAGTLTPPVIVQHDVMDTGEHLYWIYTTNQGVRGPLSRWNWDVAGEAAMVTAFDAAHAPQYEVTMEDGTVIQL